MFSFFSDHFTTELIDKNEHVYIPTNNAIVNVPEHTSQIDGSVVNVPESKFDKIGKPFFLGDINETNSHF